MPKILNFEAEIAAGLIVHLHSIFSTLLIFSDFHTAVHFLQSNLPHYSSFLISLFLDFPLLLALFSTSHMLF